MSEDKPCILSNNCPYSTAVCKVSEPDEGCYVYRYFKNRIDKDSYDEGMEDSWEMLRKIYYFENLSNDELKQIFGKEWTITNIFTSYSAKEAKEKIDNYIKQRDEEFRVGDEVTFRGERFIITRVEEDRNNALYAIRTDGLISYFNKAHQLEKTGRHFDEVETLLKKLREDNNESN